MPVQNAAQHMFRGAMSRISGTAQTPRVPYVQVEIVVYNGSQRPKVRQETIYTDTVRDKNPCFASSIELNYPKDSNRLIQFNISVRDEENRPSMLFGSCKLTLIELYDADNEKEHRIESIYGTTGSLSLVFTRKVAPQVKIPVLSVENPLRRIYRLNPEASVVVLEQASEVDLSTRLPAQFLRLCYAELNLIFEKWRTRYNSDRLKNLHFQSDHEALGYGYDVYRIGVLKARSLPRYDRKEHQTSSSSVLNRFRARAGKLVDAANRSSGGVCNPMVTLSFNDALVGKTNTEYDTTEPIFGENANVNACGHSKPFVKFHSSTETHSKVESTKDSTKEFVFYQPTIEDSNLNGMIRLDVANETFSMLNGLEHIPMGSILIDLSTLSGACVKDEHGLSATEWFPIENGLGEVLISLKIQFSTRSSPGELEIETKIQDSPISLIALDGGTTLDAVDYPYDKLDLSFVYRHVSQMKKQVEYIASLIELADRLTAEKKSFKSSQHKKREDVQGIPTNLHTGLFCVYKDLEPVASFACVTCGAPTAHALGLQEFGLRELEAEICRYHKILGIMLAEDSKTPSAALLSPRNPFIAEDSIEARFSEISIPGQIDTQMFSPSTVKKNKIKPPTLPRTVSDQKLTPIQVLERIEDLESKHHLRKTVVMSQCLSTLVTSFLSHIQVCSAETLKQFAAIGLLVGWESLISSQGKELFMLSDAWVAIRSLRHYVFQFITATTEETTEIELVKTAEKCIIQIALPALQFQKLPEMLQQGQEITIVPALFTQGINEMQSFANIVGHHGIGLQSTINASSLSVIQQYYSKYMAFSGTSLVEAENPLHRAVRNLEFAIQDESNTNKDTVILLYASDLVRGVNGARITYCKSGKDRTAMSLTLEQARIASMYHEEREKTTLEIANMMRSCGVRIQIAEKNVGRPKYSFNSLQRKLLPEMYRPPLSTIQDMVTSVTARDS